MHSHTHHILRKTMILLLAFTGGVIVTVMAATSYDATTIFNTIKSNASGKTPLEQAATYTLARIHIGLLMRELPIVDARLVAELAALPGTNTAIIDTVIANIGNADTTSTTSTSSNTGTNTTGASTSTNVTGSTATATNATGTSTSTNVTGSTATTNSGTTSGCTGSGRTFEFTNTSQTRQCIGVMPATGTRGESKTVRATQGSGSAILTCRATGWTVESSDCLVDKTPVAQVPTPTVALQVVGLAAGSLGYAPVKVGTTLTINYRATNMIQCQGTQVRTGTNQGSDIQFAYTSRDGSTGMSNSTNQPTGSFSVKIDAPTTVKFTCIGIDKKSYVEALDLKVKDHNDTDTYIDVDKTTITNAGEAVMISWQAYSETTSYPTTFCHLAKTHSMNGIKGNATVFLEATIDLSTRHSGTITDTIVTPGQYVYTLLCNNTRQGYLDSGDGSMITSRAVVYGPATTATIAPTTTTFSSTRYSMGTDDSFTLTLGGNNTPTRYEYNINDGTNFQSYASSTFTATPRAVGWGAGTYKMGVRACNSAGCSATLVYQNLTVTAPVVTVLAPTTTTFSSTRYSMGTDESFTLTFGGNNSPTRYEYNINDGANFLSYASSTYTATPGAVGWGAGTYKMGVRACNSAGCSSTVVYQNLTVTAPPPPPPPPPPLPPPSEVATTIAPTTTTFESSRYSMGMDDSFTLTFGGNNSPTRYEYNVNGDVFRSYASSIFTATPRGVGWGAGTYSMGVKACNSAGCSSSITYRNLSVN